MPMRWTVLKNWFVAHKIHKMEPAYVVSAKYVHIAKVFVTATTGGEVKLWDNKYCDCLGILNSANWDPRDLQRHMGRLRKVEQPVVTPAEEEPVVTSAGNKAKPGAKNLLGSQQQQKPNERRTGGSQLLQLKPTGLI